MPHTTNISITKMVGNRLPFLDLTDVPTTELISNYIVEVMAYLEVCLNVNEYDAEGNVTVSNIGDEAEYSLQQKSLIADCVAVYILFTQIGYGMNGESSTTTTPSTNGVFLKKAKAGSAEVEYDQFDASNSTQFGLSGAKVKDLIDLYQKQAIIKGKALGCFFCFMDGCLHLNQLPSGVAPFIVVKHKTCC